PVSRAQGCLLGQVIGDSLGSRVEGKSAAEITLLYPDAVRELADGGPYHLLAGQPTDDSEMALILARSILRERRYDRDKVLDAYRDWLTTRPVDVGRTTEQGLLGLLTTGSESNGSLMRVSPLGIWAAGDPALAAGALLGAAGGREAILPRWLMTVLTCRALPEAGALRPRPIECWPDDALEVAEALLMARSS